MKRNLLLFVALICNLSFAQTDYLNDSKSLEILKEKFEFAEKNELYLKPINEAFLEVAKSFIGTEYEGFVLEKPESEKVFCYLEGLDCVSLVENSLVIARLAKMKKLNQEDFLKELELIRYRNGVNNGYTSRSHYYSDWLANNEKRGILKIISAELGGSKILTQKISFMTKNRKLYRQIKEDDKAFEEIKAIEKELNQRKIFYIGKEQFTGKGTRAKLNIHNLLQDGDLIGFVSADETMDIQHSTIAIKQNERFHILHASKPGTKVGITEKPIDEYIAALKNVKGILVARLQEPE